MFKHAHMKMKMKLTGGNIKDNEIEINFVVSLANENRENICKMN